MTIDRDHWRRYAAEWTAWARAPSHDVFWSYRAALAAFVGRGSGPALEVGCGEGRISRELTALGYRVTATDPVPEMVEAAATAHSADTHAVAAGTALPFPDGRFRLVVAYNVLMDVDDMPATVAEMARVLAPDGEMVISLVHPFRDRGRFAAATADSPFVLEGSYYGRQRFEIAVEEDGLPMHFAGWSLPLEAYSAALEAAGFAITALREPQPEPPPPGGRVILQQAMRLPIFLWLKARRLRPQTSC